jgi:hypothetical protein
MVVAKKKDKGKTKAKAKAKVKAKVKVKVKAPKAKPKSKAKPKGRPPARPERAPARKGAAAAEARKPKARGAVAGKGRPSAAAPSGAEAPAKPRSTRHSRRSSTRRGADGRPIVPGSVLLPGGPRGPEEVQYLLRGCVSSEQAVPEARIMDALAKRDDGHGLDPAELARELTAASRRFESGSIEPLLPGRIPLVRRTFASVVERAVMRRREIGAFLRGLDIGGTETSHMDPHGEGSLQNLMEWAARLETLAEADEPGQADYSQFHRVLDQLESSTEALIVDVELTLRRLRDRVRS